MKKIKKFMLAIVALMMTILGVSVLPNKPVYADEASADYRLGITPTQKGFGTVQPGDSFSETFKVKNTGQQPFEFAITFAPYSVESETYSANYTKITRYTEIADWLSVDRESGTVQPGEEAEITYTVSIPSDAHGGAQAGVIMVSMGDTEQDNSGGLEAIRQLGYIVYANVDGEITTTGKILENKIPGFIFTPPITATSLVENTGNVYTNASYSLQVFPLFSDEEVYTNEESPENSVVFPETKRFFTASWEGAPQLGIFRVRQTVKIFDEVSTVEKLVFLCPIWFLFIVVLIIFVAIFWIVSRIRGRNKE